MSNEYTPVFEPGWEQKPDLDRHVHEWELVVVSHPGAFNGDLVERCTICQCPRCSRNSVHGFQCESRRHHRDAHRFADNSTEEVGA